MAHQGARPQSYEKRGGHSPSYLEIVNMAAKKTRTPKTPSKSDFIRSQPVSLTVSEVVEKARESGIKIHPNLVYKVRGRSVAKRPKKAANERSRGASNGAARRRAESKAAFVRAHSDLSPKEIVEKAKTAGVDLDAGYVYNVRASQRSTRNTMGVAKKAAKAAATAYVHLPPVPPTTNEEELLKIIAAEVGLARAIDLLQGERARVRAILRG
jgi:hypothetical protein